MQSEDYLYFYGKRTRISKISRRKTQAHYLFEEEVVAQVIQHHGVGRVDIVRLGQHLHSSANVLWLLLIELQHGQAHQGTHTHAVQLQRSFEGQSSLVLIAELHETVPHPKPDRRRAVGIGPQGFLVEC